MKKAVIILIIFALVLVPTYSKSTKPKVASKKKGVISKIGDAATRGFGFGLGREVAKETIKGAKNFINKNSDTDKNKKK